MPSESSAATNVEGSGATPNEPGASVEASSAAQLRSGSGLSDYDKGYLDGLLFASRHAGAKKRPEVYKTDAENYLKSRGFKDWSVNVRRI